MRESTRPACYEFGGYRLDARRCRLESIDDSLPVRLPPRVFETLLYLVEHPGELIDKSALLDAVWPDASADENSLSQSISILRRTLGESPSEHRFVVTVPGRGYRFVAPVRKVEPPSDHETTPDPAAGPDIRKPTTTDDAHMLWVQAQGLANRPSADNLRGALALLTQASAIDPRMARIWSLMSRIYTTCIAYDYPVDDALALGESTSRRAIELDSADATSFAALGVVHALHGRWLDAALEFRRAEDLGPDALVKNLHAVHVNQAVGHLNRSLEDAFDAYRLSTAHGFDANMIAYTQSLRGRDDEALSWADKAAAFGMPVRMSPQADIRAHLAYRAGRHADAAALWQDNCSAAFRAAGGPEAIDVVCAAVRDPSLRSRATSSLRAIEGRLSSRQLDQTLRKRLIVWYTMLDDLDAAHDLMDRSLTHYAQLGFVGSAWGTLWLPEMQPFRRDPRFQAVARQLNLFAYWEKYGPPDGYELSPGGYVKATALFEVS